MKTTYAALIALLALFSSNTFAQITVNRSVIEFSADGRVQDIEVMNSGDYKIYLDMKVSEIINPESDNATRKLLNDPRTASVLVSPRQLLVPPGQRKRVRVILRDEPGASDRVFRLTVSPYTGKAKITTKGGDKKSSAIKVLVGYDLLLMSRPRNLQPKVDVKRTDQFIEFSNRGNTNVLLRKITQCDPAKTDCVDLQPNRLYVGETYRIDLPKAGNANQFPVQVWKSVGLENSEDTY